ncbi:hypothetical protein [Burkholderia ubonensis]|uniref:hypothetical protein n=1 Tax=Burkholderia ubonensis TaxID=101571 RepID=UPI0011607131|nr:hypothetical protein [Burkholderia ubonensis]
MNDFRDKSEVVDKELSEFFDCEIKEILLLLDGLAGRSDKLLCDAKKESGVQELIKKYGGSPFGRARSLTRMWNSCSRQNAN